MEKKKWTLVNAENVTPFVCGDAYSSKMLTGDEMAGMQVININEGTLKPGSRTGGGAHEDVEIYYIVSGEGDVWMDEDRIPVKSGDIIVIPPHVFHWIDNTKSDKPFILFTFWHKQEDNEVFHARKEAWGTSVKNVDDQYTEKRLQGK
ncbi:MAG: cupin domain-containing protein [Clostridia bacterium]|nr:cupin domain-containing protein [Clostridia bacterium]